MRVAAKEAAQVAARAQRGLRPPPRGSPAGSPVRRAPRPQSQRGAARPSIIFSPIHVAMKGPMKQIVVSQIGPLGAACKAAFGCCFEIWRTQTPAAQAVPGPCNR